MKFVSDLLSVILFFATYTVTKNMIAATAVALVAGVVQAVFLYWKNKRLDTMQWVSLLLIVIFGGATIILGDSRFIMWKPTVLFWCGASIGREISLPDAVWGKLTYMWVGFLIFMGIANWFVFTRFEAQWVNYKMFGSTALMLVFFIIQGIYLSTYLKKED